MQCKNLASSLILKRGAGPMLELIARIIFFLCLLAFVFPLLHVKKPEEYFGMFDFILQVFKSSWGMLP